MPHEKGQLHRLLRTQKWEEAQKLVKSKRGKDLAKQVLDGKLPIHVAVRQYCLLPPERLDREAVTERDETVKQLLEVYPEGAKTKDEYGNLPIHLAVGINKSWEIFNKLANMYEEGLSQPNSDGEWPAHCISRSSDAKVVEELISRCPECLKQTNGDGRLPIHEILAFCHVKESVLIELMVKGYPESVKEPDSNGNLPLHHAAAHWNPNSLLQYLIRQYPEGVKHKNKDGRLPIHLAARAADVGATFLLEEEYPQSLYELDADLESPFACYCTDHKLQDIHYEDIAKLMEHISCQLQGSNDLVRVLSKDKMELKQKLAAIRKESALYREFLTDAVALAKKEKMEIEQTREDVREEQDPLFGENHHVKDKLLSVMQEKAQLVQVHATLQEKVTTLENSLCSVEREKMQVQNELVSVMQENERLEKENKSVTDSLASVQGKLNTLRKVAIKARKSEICFLQSLHPGTPTVATPTLETLKATAQSLNMRIDALKEVLEPTGSEGPSTTQMCLSYKLNDPDDPEALSVKLLKVIGDLNKELTNLESQFNALPDEESNDEDAQAASGSKKGARAVDGASVESPEPAAKRARESLSPAV